MVGNTRTDAMRRIFWIYLLNEILWFINIVSLFLVCLSGVRGSGVPKVAFGRGRRQLYAEHPRSPCEQAYDLRKAALLWARTRPVRLRAAWYGADTIQK